MSRSNTSYSEEFHKAEVRERLKERLNEKLKEAVNAVLPIIVIVMALCFTIVPVSTDTMLEFLVGAVMLVIGMMFFTLGAEMAMTPMGERVGSSMTRSKKLWVMVVLGFILGPTFEENLRRCSEAIEDLAEQVMMTEDEAIVAILKGMSRRKDRNEEMRNLTIPELMIFGRGDNYIPVAAAETMIAAQPQARVAWLDGSGHMGFVEQPAESLAILTDFLAEVAARKN